MLGSLSPIFSKYLWPLSIATAAALGPRVNKVTKSAARIAFQGIGGRRFLTIALPDNLSMIASIIFPSFRAQLLTACTLSSKIALWARIFTITVVDCWAVDRVRQRISSFSKRYFSFFAPSDEERTEKASRTWKSHGEEPCKMVSCPVGLSSDVQQKIEDLYYEFRFSKRCKNYQMTPLCGILLHGPTGTGKTSLARHLASRLGCLGKNCEFISAPSLLNSHIGQSEANVRALFERASCRAIQSADRKEPIVIVIDEIDAVLGSRSHNLEIRSVLGTSLVDQFLTSMDQIKELKNVLLIGITNFKDHLDSAAIRAGRFDQHLHIDRPDPSGVRDIVNYYLRPLREKHIIDEEIDENRIFKKAEGMTGAEIEALVANAKRSAMRRCRALSSDESNFLPIDIADFGISKIVDSDICEKESVRREDLVSQQNACKCGRGQQSPTSTQSNTAIDGSKPVQSALISRPKSSPRSIQNVESNHVRGSTQSLNPRKNPTGNKKHLAQNSPERQSRRLSYQTH